MISDMSDKESKFMQILTTVLGSFLLATAIGMFVFYRVTIVSLAVQEERIKANEVSVKNQEIKVEIMRIEIREDLKDIKMNVDKIAESQARNNNYK